VHPKLALLMLMGCRLCRQSGSTWAWRIISPNNEWKLMYTKQRSGKNGRGWDCTRNHSSFNNLTYAVEIPWDTMPGSYVKQLLASRALAEFMLVSN
jgi:hypothetical protein